MVYYSAEARFWDKSKLPWQKITIPAPYDPTTPGLPTWNVRWAKEALNMRKVGFGGLAYMPMLKTQSGMYNTGDGYGWNGDLDDIGTKGPTRAGLGQDLLRMVANWNACGMEFGANIVSHQMMGDGSGETGYPNWKGEKNKGHTFWHKGNLRRFRGEDPVWEQPDFGFGDEFVYYNSKPAGDTARDMIAGWYRLWKRVGFTFARADDVKGEYLPFVKDLCQRLRNVRITGELFDGSAGQLVNYLDAIGNLPNFSLFDFDTHWALQQILSQAYGDMRKMNGRGLNAVRPFQARTFVDNADTDLSDGQPVIGAKRRCYAWLLTVEGEPQVYHKDYSTDSGCYGLKEFIDPMILAHQVCATGRTTTRWVDPLTMVLERDGGLISAFSTDPINKQRRTVYTNYRPGMWLHDMSGQHGQVKVAHDSTITFDIPSDVNGRGNSYLMFIPAELAGTKFDIHPRPTTQTLYGADDRDVAPAVAESITDHWPFWCEANTVFEAHTKTDMRGVAVEVVQPDGMVVLPTKGVCRTVKRGWHTVRTVNPNTDDVPVEIAVTYVGTKDLTDAEAKIPAPRINQIRPMRK